MSAQEALGPQFMTARQLRELSPGDRAGRTAAKVWASKSRENRRSGLNADVSRRGVQVPVVLAHFDAEEASAVTGRTITSPVIREGHHRIAAAYKFDPDSLVPVEHIDLRIPEDDED
jgi:hypothetical protein